MTNEMLAPEVENPFARAPVVARPVESNVMAGIASAREVAEVQAAMVNARHFPRVEVEVMDRILQACTRPSLAESALYEYARGGTDIRGPSVRLAECLAQYWGHLDFGWRVLEERPGATKVQTFAWDLQTGTRAQVVFDVIHERMARGSRQTLHDPRDIYEHVANAASRRLRACILRVIPGDVVEAAVKQCELTLVTKVAITPERLKNLVDQFGEFGVTKVAIEKRIQRRIDAITPGIMVQLGKIFTSLRDNMSQPSDWFDLGDAQTGAQTAQEGSGAPIAPSAAPSAREAVKRRLQSGKPPPAPPASTPAPAPADPQPQPAPATQPDPSPAFLDAINFARAAQTLGDIERASQIAQQITDEAEVQLAQQHIDAARRRLKT
jgi:hypothetical protein